MSSTVHTTRTPPHRTGEVLTAVGYGLRVAVERGHLLVEDGVGADRGRFVFSRIDEQLKRLVIIGHAGTISLVAIRWLYGVGVPFIPLVMNGTFLLVAMPSGA